MPVETESPPRILFVTGRLAEPALRDLLPRLAQRHQFEYEIEVLGISVAALMHTDWVVRKLDQSSQRENITPQKFQKVVLPGFCQGSLEGLMGAYQLPFERGPKDMYDLPLYFGEQQKEPPDLTKYDTEIIAEINHAPRLTDKEILQLAERYRQSGADVIDLGCIPGEVWARAGAVTRLLVAEGFRISIDSFDQQEVSDAVVQGAELVLSCNQTNLQWAKQLGVELVAIPDQPHDLTSLEKTVAELSAMNIPFRVDPILEPISFGFMASLVRYYEARRKWPELEIMMGIGNLTELSEVDSAGVNFLFAGICQELQIRSVLTTEVINWCQTAVQEFDHARRLMHYCFERRTLPKHLDSSLVMLRDPRVHERGVEALTQMQSQIKDPNFRIFVERGELHLMNRDGYWHGTDPYELFDDIFSERNDLESSHAFYLGYELSKAVTALTLGKEYRQDQALSWGFLTIPEISAHERRRQQSRESS
ncbi:MAG: dihydropteroate synthase [Planctomycetaceae bacterium]|nr:dihydropteroate synthase [Planctomycetaceae bacterium]